jgi:hypothetical protein
MAAGPPPSSFQTSPWLPSEADSAPVGNAMPPLETSATNNNINRAAVAVACVQCRSRHLKCDGAARCARCVAEGISCSYVKSRRGWKGPRKSSRLSENAPSISTVPSHWEEIRSSLTIDRPTRTTRLLHQLCITTGCLPRSAKPFSPLIQDSGGNAICRRHQIA